MHGKSVSCANSFPTRSGIKCSFTVRSSLFYGGAMAALLIYVPFWPLRRLEGLNMLLAYLGQKEGILFTGLFNVKCPLSHRPESKAQWAGKWYTLVNR